jgi:hypothetical protein
MTAAWLSLSLLAALGVYLACAHQQLWPRARGHARGLHLAAVACAACALAAAIADLGVTAGVFAASTAFMLATVLLPYLDAWRRLRKERRHVG